MRRVRTGAAIFVRAPLPRLAVLLTSLVSDVSTDLWARALNWHIAREAGALRNPKAFADVVVIFALSVALAWCVNRESL